MSNDRIRITQDFLDEPIRARLGGGRWMAIAAASVIGALALWGIWDELHTANNLKREENELRYRELDIKIVQTELARRQYTLDSAKFATQQHDR